MWADLRISHFENMVTTGNGTKIVLKRKRALWFLWFPEYGATTVAKVFLFST